MLQGCSKDAYGAKMALQELVLISQDGVLRVAEDVGELSKLAISDL